MKKLLSTLSIAPFAITACGGGGGSSSSNFEFAHNIANKVHYAGSMIGEEVTLGEARFSIVENGQSKEVIIGEASDYTVEIKGKETIDTSQKGEYDLAYIIKDKNGKATSNEAKLKYSVYDPITSRINTVENQNKAKILYVHVNSSDDATMPPQNYVEEWRSQMEEAYDYNFEDLDFDVQLHYKTLNKTTAQLLADWNNLPVSERTNDDQKYGLDYYMFVEAIRDSYSSFTWGEYDAISFSVSRVASEAGESTLGVAERDLLVIPEITNAFPDLKDKLKDPTQTVHKNTVGIGYSASFEQLRGSTNYKPDFYKTQSGLKWTLSDPSTANIFSNILNSEIGSKNLQGDFDMSRVDINKFPTVRNNLIGGNKWYNAISTIMHETMHLFNTNHSKATNSFLPDLYDKFLEKPWSRKVYSTDPSMTDEQCDAIGEATDKCQWLYNDYLDPFDNMSTGEMAERFSVNTRGSLFGSKYDRINPTTTAQSVTVKPGVKEFKEIYLPLANTRAKQEDGEYANHLHTLSIEFFGNDPLTSHFNDYGVLKDNLEGIIIRYTMINLSDFSRDTVILDGTFDPSDPDTFMQRDYKYAFKAGQSINFQGVKIDITNVDQVNGATFNVTKI